MQQSPVFQWGKNYIDKLDLSESQTILDIGCRRGSLSAYLANRYKQQRVTAIDNIETEIELAQAYHLSNLTFDTVDALQLDCTYTFDAVISLSCLHWIKDKYQLNCYRRSDIYQAVISQGLID